MSSSRRCCVLTVGLVALVAACVPGSDPSNESPLPTPSATGGAVATGGVGQTGGAPPATGGVGASTGGSAPVATGGVGAGTGGSAPAGSGGSNDTAAAPEVGPSDTAPPGDGMPSLAPVPSAACAGGAMTPGPSGTQTVQSPAGRNRSFILRLPAGYDGKKPFPILLSFHGAGGGAQEFEGSAYGGVARMAADKAIRIFPQSFGGNTWSRDEPDDVKFMDVVFAWLDEKLCYDKARVYAGGQSSGAYFANRLACDRGERIRAVATNSGGQRRERKLECTTAVSAWLSTGAQDNPGHVMGTEQARDVWLKLAGCSSTPMPTTPSPCVSYGGCRPGYQVHFCKHGGGHAVPGYAAAGIYNFLFGGKL